MDIIYMLPFGLQLKSFETLRHIPMNLELFNFEKEKERDNKVFGILKKKKDSKTNRKKQKRNKTVKLLNI